MCFFFVFISYITKFEAKSNMVRHEVDKGLLNFLVFFYLLENVPRYKPASLPLLLVVFCEGYVHSVEKHMMLTNIIYRLPNFIILFFLIEY